MKKFIFNEKLLCVLLVLASIIGLFLYAKIDLLSIANNQNETITEVKLTKYVNYSEEWGKGVLVQYNIKTGIQYADELEPSPIKDSKIVVSFPEINGVHPDNVTVINKSTLATNGKEKNADAKYTLDYTYDQNIGSVTITATNEDEDGNPIYDEINKKARDEYEIIFNYDETAYNAENNENELVLHVETTQNLFAKENNKIESIGDFKKTVSENIGSIFSIKQRTSEVYNGYIKSNIINGTTYSTTYKQNDEIQVSNKESLENIYVLNNNTFVNENNSENLGNNANLVFKTTKICKNDIINLLGKDGIVEIQDADQNLLATIDNKTEFNEDGTYTITYENEPEAIIIKTSNVINEGILRLESIKEIKPTMQQTENIKIKTTWQTVNKKISEKIIDIKNAETKVEFSINTDEWTNERQNEIEFNIGLNSSSIKYNLFKNPTIKFELPKQIEKVILGEYSILNGNDLQIENVTAEKNEKGNYVIVISITGEQTKYDINELGIMPSIKIPATIILNQDIENCEENIKASYQNHYSLDNSIEEGQAIKEIKIINYREEDNNSGEIEQDNNQEKTIETKGTQYDTENLTRQNKEVEITSEINELQKTNLQSNLYENIDLAVSATKGGKNLNNGDIVYENEYIKYIYKIKNNSEDDLDNVKITASIPEGLAYGELHSEFGKEDVIYDYNFDSSLREKQFIINKIKAGDTYTGYYEVKVNNLTSTESTKEITSDIKLNINETEVKTSSIKNIVNKAKTKVFVKANTDAEKDSWYYQIYVETESEATLRFKMPENFEFDYITHIEDEEEGGLKMSEDKYSIQDEFVVTNVVSGIYEIGGIIDSKKFNTNNNKDNQVELSNYAVVVSNDIEYYSNEARIIVKYENISIKMESENEGETVKPGDEINYKIIITNNGGTSTPDTTYATHINVKDYLPKYLEPISVIYENWIAEKNVITYDSNGNEGAVEYTGVYRKEVKTEDIFEYKDGTEDFTPCVDIYIDIPYGETANILIKTIAMAVEEQVEIENKASITDGSYEENIFKDKVSNSVKHIIKNDGEELSSNGLEILGKDDFANVEENPQEGSNSDNNPEDENGLDDNNAQDNKPSISGLAWFDENKNGKRDAEEKVFKNVTVMLVDIKDKDTIKAKTQTDENGSYSFKELESGKYIVIFEYNTEVYSITSYKKSGISSELNSDAQENKIKINGEEKTVGVTDTLQLSKSLNNIDIGLITYKTSNIKLDKVITNITTQTSKNVKQKSYNNVKLAKTEIRAKEISTAKVIVEYSIFISNNGDVATNVGTIIENLPAGFKFVDGKNTGWVSKGSNKYVNTSIENKELSAGQTVELKVLLEKELNENETGTFTNKVFLQNASSSADVIISIGTGSIILYFSLIIAILSILGIGVYFIRKYHGKTIIKTSFVIVLVAIIAGSFGTSMGVNVNRTSWGNYWGIANTTVAEAGLSLNKNTIVYFDYMGRASYPNEDWAKHYRTVFAVKGTGNKVIGRCIQSGLNGGDSNTPRRYYGYDLQETKTTISNKNKFTLAKKNASVAVNPGNNDCILGPLKFNSQNGTKVVGVVVKNKNGGEVSSTMCNSSGAPKTISANNTNDQEFYVKISKANYTGYGVYSITLTVEYTADQVVTKYGQLRYKNDTCQNIRTFYAYPVSSSTTPNITLRKSISWTNFARSIEIIKQDYDDDSVKLAGVKMNVTNSRHNYNKTFITDSTGKIQIINDNDLIASEDDNDAYLVTEIENNNYGYNNTYNINNKYKFFVQKNIGSTIIFPNKKNTGNISITKRDKDTDEVVSGVKFILKNSDGYIKAEENRISNEVLEEGETEETVDAFTGTIYLKNMYTVEKREDATEFTVDEAGVLEIYNIITGNYTIEESSVGENKQYTIDDSCIEWTINGKKTQGVGANFTVERQRSYDTIPSSKIINDNKKTIKDGTYELSTKFIHTDNKTPLVMDLPGGGSDNSIQFQIWTRNSTLAQKFYVKYEGDGYYTLRCLADNKLVDLQNQGTTGGTPVQAYHANKTIAQYWKILHYQDFKDFDKNKTELKNCYKIYTKVGYKGDRKDNCIDIKMNPTRDVSTIAHNKKRRKQDLTTIHLENSDSYAQYFIFNSEVTSRDTINEIYVTNRAKYIKVSGNVWEDNNQGTKTSENVIGANIFGDEDIRLQGVKVTLKNSDGTVAEKDIENSKFVNPVYTDESGKYTFQDVLIDELSNYYIDFEYDGEIYKTVETYKELNYSEQNAPTNTSKAQEVSTQRDALDNKYQSVSASGNTDESIVSNDFNVKYELSTFSINQTAKTKYRTKFDSSLNEKVRNVNQFSSNDGYISENLITANTKVTGYNVLGGNTASSEEFVDNSISNGAETVQRIRTLGLTEIANRNCGLKKRDQIDLSVSSDIDNVEFTVNGYKNNYKYNFSQNVTNPEENEQFRLDVNANRYGAITPLYRSDLLWDNGDKVNPEICELYVIYKMTVSNNTMNLSAKVPDLLGYYDSDNYEIYATYYKSNPSELDTTHIPNAEKQVRESLKGTKISGTKYSVTHFTELKDTIIPKGESRSFYVKYKVNPMSVMSLLKQENSEGVTFEAPSIIEINSYTTYYDTLGNKTYASIDKDSAPGNHAIASNTFEDDVAGAPKLVLKLTDGERTISGTVFEDEQTRDSAEHNERLGDGIYKTEDGTVEGVEVALLNYSDELTEEGAEKATKENGGIATLYKYEGYDTQNNKYKRNMEPAIIEKTNSSGAYQFTGIIPGKYILRFKYADGNIVYKTGEANKTISANDYKATIITSSVIKDALNNNIIVGDGNTKYIITPDGSTYSSNQWHVLNEMTDGTTKTYITEAEKANLIRYSDAMDTNGTIEKAIGVEESDENTIINHESYTANKAISKFAYTGAMNIQIEFNKDELSKDTNETTTTMLVKGKDSEGKDTFYITEHITYEAHNIDFGIIQKAKIMYDLKKTIENIKLSTYTGNILINGNPSSGNLKNTQYLDDTIHGRRRDIVKVEIENDSLHGSTLEVTYKVNAVNNSEKNFSTGGYYRYGTDKLNPETLKVTKILDYLDNDYVYQREDDSRIINGNIVGDNIKLSDGTELNAQKYLDDSGENSVLNTAKKYKTLLVLYGDKELSTENLEGETWTYKASKVLTNSSDINEEDLEFINSAECIEYIASKSTSVITIPGNYNPSTSSPDERDNFANEIVITSPQGNDKSNVIYIAIATGAIILATGIYVIKKKVLDFSTKQ